MRHTPPAEDADDLPVLELSVVGGGEDPCLAAESLAGLAPEGLPSA
ncbi:hypothetical protein [Saccharothrix stipae]